jgi:hypothetical protein
MRRFLPALLLGCLPACVFAITDVEVTRADGSTDSYSVKRRGDGLSLIEARWGGGSKISSARAIVFADLNGDRRVDRGEVLHDLVLQMDSPARSVQWKNIRLDSGSHDGPFLVELRLSGEGRPNVRRTLGVNPESLFHEFDVWE